jgi:hypothetical protein
MIAKVSSRDISKKCPKHYSPYADIAAYAFDADNRRGVADVTLKRV